MKVRKIPNRGNITLGYSPYSSYRPIINLVSSRGLLNKEHNVLHRPLYARLILIKMSIRGLHYICSAGKTFVLGNPMVSHL